MRRAHGRRHFAHDDPATLEADLGGEARGGGLLKKGLRTVIRPPLQANQYVRVRTGETNEDAL